MKSFFRTYMPFAKAGTQQMMAYKVNFIFHLIGEIMSCFIMFFIWKAVFTSTDGKTFMGFTMNDMIVYIFISFMTGYLSYSDGAFVLGEEIRDGSVSMRLIKPCSFDMCFLFQEIGNRVISYGIIFVPIVAGVEIYRYFLMGSVQFNVGNFIMFFISLQFAYLINFYFNIIYGFLAFYLKNLWGTTLIKDVIVNFLSGATIPLAFMPFALQTFLTYLPFSSLSYTPVMIYMGMYTWDKILFSMALQIFWIFAFWGISKLIWRSAIRRICVQGG